MRSRLAGTLLRQARPARPAAARRLPALRRMGGGGHRLGDQLHISSTHMQIGGVMTTLCWVWMMWRAYQDGAVVLGLVHPWEAHGHGHHDHGPRIKYKEVSFSDEPPEAEEVEEEEHGEEHEEEEE